MSWSIVLLALIAVDPLPDFVEPSELAKRPDLIGHDVVIDDRVRFFIESRRGQGFDELHLRRTDVVFRLPARFRQAQAPTDPNIRVQGILKSEDGRLVCDVTALESMPPDLERLDKEIAKLRADDFARRKTWALWAERRGKELTDPKVEARGEALELESLWIEADRPNADPIALARRSESRPIPLVARNALAHRGFRAKLARVNSVAELDELAKEIPTFLPASTDPSRATGADTGWLEAYAKDPALAYRECPPPVRPALDRRLLADTIQRSMEKQVAADSAQARTLAEAATTTLADRPEVAERLRRLGLDDLESKVVTMRQAEVEDLSRTFKEQGDEERGRRLCRTWLAYRRKNRLSATDADGRLLLAANYVKLLADRSTAGDLLREALAIDPGSKAVVDAFLRLGFRKRDDTWYDPSLAKAETPEPARAGETDDSLKGLTRAQVRSRLGGKPDTIARSATQGRCVEQWIYRNGKRFQVVNFSIEPGTSEVRASSYYSDQK